MERPSLPRRSPPWLEVRFIASNFAEAGAAVRPLALVVGVQRSTRVRLTCQQVQPDRDKDFLGAHSKPLGTRLGHLRLPLEAFPYESRTAAAPDEAPRDSATMRELLAPTGMRSIFVCARSPVPRAVFAPLGSPPAEAIAGTPRGGSRRASAAGTTPSG